MSPDKKPVLRIKNWAEFQHFKDRNPPWIKLHKNVLERRDISAISDQSFRVLIGLWLLASEDKNKQGNLPDIWDICFRLRMEEGKVIKALSELDSFVISSGYQRDAPEKRRDREETEVHLSLFEEFWGLYPNKKGKEKAFKYFHGALSNSTIEDILLGLETYKLNKEDWRPWMMPATWLNGKHWLDEYGDPVDDTPATAEEIAAAERARTAQ